MPPKPVPDNFHTVTPYLVVADVARLVDFLKQAFDAVETERMAGPDGAVMHATVRIGDSMVMMGRAGEGFPPMPTMLYLYGPDADASYRRALKAGATSVREVRDEFYGDRSGGVKDFAGNQWWVATHKEDVSPEEMKRRMQERAKQGAPA
jgi:uncharacterized glyoxalase superfamily protein PhnB